MTNSLSPHGAPSSNRMRAWRGARALRLLAVSAAVALAAPATLAFANTVHTVSPGETASGIADQYGVSLESIASYNGIKNVDYIVAGSKLTIPGGSGGDAPVDAASSSANIQYRVRAGDTLSHIAQEFGATIKEIAALNDLDNENHIVEGQILVVPANELPVGPTSYTPGDARSMLLDAAVEFGIVPDLVLALAWQESGWQMHLVSSAGAIGIMQVMPATANWAIEDLGVEDAEDWRTNPRSNIRVGAAVLSQLIDQAGGNGDMALSFYVQGWYSVEKNGWFDETRNYIASINALRELYR